MDGVLIDSLKTHFYAFNATFKKFGAKEVSLKTFQEKFWGIYIEKDAKTVFGNVSKHFLKELLDEYPLQIERFVKYIRRYDSIKNDEQLEVLLQICISRNPEAYTSIGVDIPGHIRFIRQMALKSDDWIKDYFRKQLTVNKDPVYEDIFTNSSKKRAIQEMTDAAKDVKADPRRFARKVDQEFRS